MTLSRERTRRAQLAAAGLLLSLGVAGHATPALAQSPSASMSLSTWADLVAEDVDAFWKDVFAASGRDWPEATWVVVDGAEAMPSPCGPAGDPDRFPDATPAFYCWNDGRTYLSAAFLSDLWASTGDFGAATVIAHEMAHHAQNVLGVAPFGWTPDTTGLGWTPDTTEIELQADCFAGAWAGAKRESLQLEPGDLDEGVTALLDAGDYEVTDPEHHGTPRERADAFVTGYTSGIDAC